MQVREFGKNVFWGLIVLDNVYGCVIIGVLCAIII